MVHFLSGVWCVLGPALTEWKANDKEIALFDADTNVECDRLSARVNHFNYVIARLP